MTLQFTIISDMAKPVKKAPVKKAPAKKAVKKAAPKKKAATKKAAPAKKKAANKPLDVANSVKKAIKDAAPEVVNIEFFEDKAVDELDKVVTSINNYFIEAKPKFFARLRAWIKS